MRHKLPWIRSHLQASRSEMCEPHDLALVPSKRSVGAQQRKVELPIVRGGE